MGMTKCLSDQCLFHRKTKAGVVIIAIYIDDTLCVGTREAVNESKRDLAQHFTTKEEGELTEYFGCEVTRQGRKTLFMSQKHLIQKLERAFLSKVSKLPKYDTPSTAGFRVIRCLDEKLRIDAEKPRMYRSGVGILLFLVKFSRPDISNIVRELSKANDGATTHHFKGLLRVIKYVLDTREKGLRYDVEKKMDSMWQIKAFCDSDFAGDQEKRISVSGFCIYLMNCLISWKSKGQDNVTLSSTEAEYVAISDLCKELMFVRMILVFLGIKVKLPIVVHCDNIGAIFLGYNAKVSQRTKHIDTKYKYVGEYVQEGIVKIVFVRSENNIADVLTKNASQEIFKKHASKLLTDLPKSKDRKGVGR